MFDESRAILPQTRESRSACCTVATLRRDVRDTLRCVRLNMSTRVRCMSLQLEASAPEVPHHVCREPRDLAADETVAQRVASVATRFAASASTCPRGSFLVQQDKTSCRTARLFECVVQVKSELFSCWISVFEQKVEIQRENVVLDFSWRSVSVHLLWRRARKCLTKICECLKGFC